MQIVAYTIDMLRNSSMNGEKSTGARLFTIGFVCLLLFITVLNYTCRLYCMTHKSTFTTHVYYRVIVQTVAFYNRTYLCTIHKCPSYLLSYHITNAVYDVTLYISIFNTIFFLRFPQLLWSPPPPCLHRPPSPLPRSLSHLPRTKQFQNTLRKTCKQDQTSSGICCYQFNQNPLYLHRIPTHPPSDHRPITFAFI